MQIEEPEGYRLPLRTSLTRPILLGGVPRAFAILNATIGAAIGFGLQEPLIGLPVWALVQAAGAYAAARDPWFLDTWPRAPRVP
jgi:type IV secretion system protein TrbD